MTNLSNPTDPAVLDALTRTCCICQVDPDNWCAGVDGHPWTAESTRWRRRDRTDCGRGIVTERDCLICKAVSEGNRRRRKRISERHYA